nr:SIS domain-containing protein [Chloroflexota bacterium]
MTIGTADAQYLLPGELALQPEVIRRVLTEVDPLVPAVAAAVVEGGIRDIVMTGCGDSLFSAMAASFAFLRFSRRLTIPAHALEYSRAIYRSSGPETLVCALSYSGETRRTVEAAIAAKSVGAKLLGISRDRTGTIAGQADHFLPNASLEERSNCRTGSFQAAYLALVLLGAHTAHRSGDLDDAGLESVREGIRALADAVQRYIEPAGELGRRAAEHIGKAGTVHFIGGGEAHAVALYGAAKLYETSSLPAVPQETEQFAHCEIFSLERDSVVVVTALRGPFYQRAVEVADAVRAIGAMVIGVSDEPDFERHADLLLAVPSGPFTDFSTSLAVIPLQWLAFH